ncbi:hypothetical protein ABZV58_22460 [Nocardia sp. NPDC004654]|uniref:hypothetical protein n=1 Tax=Nocardia sp. NPDC004654 TaxID=3154776 RepID=UPI0033A1C695
MFQPHQHWVGVRFNCRTITLGMGIESDADNLRREYIVVSAAAYDAKLEALCTNVTSAFSNSADGKAFEPIHRQLPRSLRQLLSWQLGNQQDIDMANGVTVLEVLHALDSNAQLRPATLPGRAGLGRTPVPLMIGILSHLYEDEKSSPSATLARRQRVQAMLGLGSCGTRKARNEERFSGYLDFIKEALTADVKRAEITTTAEEGLSTESVDARKHCR